MARYIPKGGNGGKREGAGRKAGVPNKPTWSLDLAKREARLQGKLPHLLMLEWAQDGVMPIVKKDKKGKPMKLPSGEYDYEEWPLDGPTRHAITKDCAHYFEARKVATQVTGKDNGPIQTVNVKTDADWVRNRLMAPLSVEIEDLRDPMKLIELFPPKKVN
jgi:hypothetical protein